jgi:alcohol dehydrogenase (cytochrome c)
VGRLARITRVGASAILIAMAMAVLMTADWSQAPSPSAATPPDHRPVTFERIREAESDPGNWLTYSGQYSGQRYSRLASITRANVHRLQIKWIHQLRTIDQVETTPLVVDGIMYLTRGNDVIALDAATGRPYWTHNHPVSSKVRLCCGRQNRGLALLDGRLFLATLDAQLVALDAATGVVQWTTQIADPGEGYSSTGAPLVVKGKVITGIAGGEYGIRGFIDAYDAATGARAWRFNTVPGPGEPGNETWAGDSWKTGGAPTWMTGTYDPVLNLLYWGVGNPGPDWNGSQRGGDNLYSDSVVAVDPDAGALRWHFQFTPHDEHDWDATQVPMLVDAPFGGQWRKLLYLANRNGFFYVLDRESGAFLLAREFARQTWAERIDERGRPILKSGIAPTVAGVLLAPPSNGAANWWSPSYSPDTGLYYVTAYDGRGSFFAGDTAHSEGRMYLGSSADDDDPSDEHRLSAVRAIEPSTGRRVWEFSLAPKSMSGLLASAGGVVFGGSIDGYVFALDASTGADLWHRSVGGAVVAAPITYAVEGVQYVTIAAGDAIVTLTLE